MGGVEGGGKVGGVSQSAQRLKIITLVDHYRSAEISFSNEAEIFTWTECGNFKLKKFEENNDRIMSTIEIR